MNRTSPGASFTIAAFSMVLSISATPARAGESGNVRIPTAPILYHACMSTGARVEYDSAAFSTKNPGPDLASHSRHLTAMGEAFGAWLTQNYGFNGLVNCGTYNTLAEAENWLRGRKQYVEQLPAIFNNKYYATDWTYQSGGTAEVAAPQAAQPAAPGVPTVFWFCVAIHQGIEYDSAVFEAPNNALTSRRAYFGYNAHLSERYRIGAPSTCVSKPTRAAAEAALQDYPARVQGGVRQRIETGWAYKAG